MSMILYASPMSSATPVLHALTELQVSHEVVRVDLQAGDQQKPEFLALNPNGKVPTLVVDGTPMFEALAIMQWLGDRFGVERNLWPAADAPERLEALSWSTWAYVSYISTVQRLNIASSERVPAELHHPPQAERSKKELQALLGVLEGRLAARPHLLGADFSLADLIVASAIAYSTYCGVSVEDHPHVQAWLEQFHARPACRKTWRQDAL